MVHLVRDLFVVIWLRLLHLMQRIKNAGERRKLDSCKMNLLTRRFWMDKWKENVSNGLWLLCLESGSFVFVKPISYGL